MPSGRIQNNDGNQSTHSSLIHRRSSLGLFSLNLICHVDNYFYQSFKTWIKSFFCLTKARFIAAHLWDVTLTLWRGQDPIEGGKEKPGPQDPDIYFLMRGNEKSLHRVLELILCRGGVYPRPLFEKKETLVGRG